MEEARNEISFAKKPRLKELLRQALDEIASLENALRTCQSMRIESRMHPASKLKKCLNCGREFTTLSTGRLCHICSYGRGWADAEKFHGVDEVSEDGVLIHKKSTDYNAGWDAGWNEAHDILEGQVDIPGR